MGLYRALMGIGTEKTAPRAAMPQTSSRSRCGHKFLKNKEVTRGSSHQLLQALCNAASGVQYNEDGETTGRLAAAVTSSMKNMVILVRNVIPRSLPPVFSCMWKMVVMGSCEAVPNTNDNNGRAHVVLLPGSAHNNTVGPSAACCLLLRPDPRARVFFSLIMHITLTAISCHATYITKIPYSVYNNLALTGSPIS